ncbi:MAG: hypothetical protein LAO18_02410, partial [Acidobacteriia bacterium]|nr:hypothetical protein [Terriglobia bacterium]
MRFLFRQFPALGLALVLLSAAAQNPRANPSLPAISNLHLLARNSGYIFDGTVLSVEQPSQDETDSLATVQVTFRVEQAIRGTRALGLDWSQMNVNVFTRSPAPTASDYAGLSIMHATDPINCIPISICYPNADQPKMDDRAALSRLYPVTAQNQAA